MSYGAIAVLGTFTAAIPHRWRAAWAGWWLAVFRDGLDGAERRQVHQRRARHRTGPRQPADRRPVLSAGELDGALDMAPVRVIAHAAPGSAIC